MLLFIISCLSVVEGTTEAPALQCELAPPHAQPADANYRLSVAGEPDLFLPGELYTVSLQGVDSGKGPTPFTGFTIWAEKEGRNDQDSVPPKNQSLGAFQAHDAQTKPLEHCKPAVDNATAHPKTEIQVIWSAPSNAVDTCVRLCARASPAEGDVVWAVLARKLCAAAAAPPSFTRPPPIVEPCCACDEAKYEVTFEGLWSRNTHPREFPPEAARAHFGDVIGASHTAQYRVWQEGRVASTGVRRLADDGATTALEKELKAESDHIRTIIKARGISWQQVAGGTGIPATFAVFRVDAKHHLVSLAAKLAPSPDWIVGVSALEMCNSNCTWRTSITLPLYPYDAGTDSGLAYTSRRQPTIPAAPVRALRPDWPRDVRSPFFSTSSEMRPFARLRLNRLRLYEKSCDSAEPGAEPPAEPSAGGACATHAWGAWGACSATCGPGRAARQRDYMWPARAFAEACRAPLTEYRACFGPQRHCSGPCAVTPWSEWSACAGCGVRARTRHYAAPRAHKRCHRGYRARTELSQAMPCDAGPCDRPSGIFANSTNFDWFFVDMPRGDCPTTAWGTWSPCSVRCGRGRRLRTRLFLSRDTSVQHELTRRLLREWNQRFAEVQQVEPSAENVTSETTEMEALVQEHLDRCHATLSQQEALCDGDDSSCLNATISLGHGDFSSGGISGAIEDVEVHRRSSSACISPLLDVCRSQSAPLNPTLGPCQPSCEGHPFIWPRGVPHYVYPLVASIQELVYPIGYRFYDTVDTIGKLELIGLPETCQLTMQVGPCRGYEERWFFDTVRGVCEPFGYTGCGGNANNFRNSEECLRACRRDNQTDGTTSTTTAVPTISNETTIVKKKPTFTNADNEVMQRDSPSLQDLQEDADCDTGPWLGWGDCFGECEFAIKLNYRLVMRAASGAGKQCPKLIKSRVCRPAHCRKGLATTDATISDLISIGRVSYDEE